MGDLEDKLFKKNIPGKYSLWDDNNEECEISGCGSLSSNSDIDEDPEYKSISNVPSKVQSSSGIGGVKGVLADYRLHQAEKMKEAWMNLKEKEYLMQRMTVGATLPPGEMSMSIASINARAKTEKSANRESVESDNSDGEHDDSEDESFLRHYRQQRLRELRELHLPLEWKGVEEVDQFEFSKAVDETDATVAVIVHLYEDYVPACLMLKVIMEKLSKSSLREARFLSIQASTTCLTLDCLALPSVLIYRGGHLISNLTPITTKLPSNFNFKDVQTILFDELGHTQKSHVSSRMYRDEYGTNDSDEELEGFL
jgi:Phosducin